MLITVEEYFNHNGVYDMSINELLDFKDKICDRIKHYEKNKYTEEILELEMFMHPGPSLKYHWDCDCLLELCRIIMLHQDCKHELKEKCKRYSIDARQKIRQGLYPKDDEHLKAYAMNEWLKREKMYK